MSIKNTIKIILSQWKVYHHITATEPLRITQEIYYVAGLEPFRRLLSQHESVSFSAAGGGIYTANKLDDFIQICVLPERNESHHNRSYDSDLL